jgi:hypothetical protein
MNVRRDLMAEITLAKKGNEKKKEMNNVRMIDREERA